MKEDFDTLVEAMQYLRTEGYKEDFNLEKNRLVCKARNHEAFHNQFEIDKVYRFEGMTNPSDESILYAISSDNGNVKGVMVNSYGIYAEDVEEEMAKKLSFAERRRGEK